MKKFASALVGLLILTAVLTWPLNTKPVKANAGGSWLYHQMLGTRNSSSELEGSVRIGRFEYGNPLCAYWHNITFGEPWFHPGGGWIVNLTVPQATYHAKPEYDYEKGIGLWVLTAVTMNVDGYGWLFLNATGDVDCYTSNNNTGSYWISPSAKAGTKAADPGELPFLGPDGVAGTADDGFGDGTADPRGSSVLYTKTTVTAHYASEATGWTWLFLYSYNWTSVWTTGVAYDIVNEATSGLDGVSAREEGHPWDFIAGKKHAGEPGYYPVPHGHPKWNAYVTYVSSWSQHNIDTALGLLDLQIAERKKLVREDCVICDINCDEKVTITGVVIAALAFGTMDEGVGPDGKPGTPDDIIIPPWPIYDPRGDLNCDGKITIIDLVIIALDFGSKLTPDCIIWP